MTFEQLVGEALHAADDYQPSPDLFAKVQRSIDEDAAHRVRVRNLVVAVGFGLVAVLAYVALTAEIGGGTVSMPFRALEALVSAVMVVVVLAVGPAIRRFGETYEGAVFRASPDTGAQVLRLLDISYYLIFSAYILMSLTFDPLDDFGTGLAGSLHAQFVRLGGLLLLMGVLHVVLLLALPVVGLVFSANQRRARIAGGYAAADVVADRIDRVITVAAWVVAGIVALQLLFGALSFFVSLGAQ